MAWCATRSFHMPSMDAIALWKWAPFIIGIGCVSVAGTTLWCSSSSSSKRSVPFACLGISTESRDNVDMVKAGIIDPVKVVTTAVVDAASVSLLLTTTEAAIVDDLNDKNKPPSHVPDMDELY